MGSNATAPDIASEFANFMAELSGLESLSVSTRSSLLLLAPSPSPSPSSVPWPLPLPLLSQPSETKSPASYVASGVGIAVRSELRRSTNARSDAVRHRRSHDRHRGSNTNGRVDVDCGYGN